MARSVLSRFRAPGAMAGVAGEACSCKQGGSLAEIPCWIKAVSHGRPPRPCSCSSEHRATQSAAAGPVSAPARAMAGSRANPDGGKATRSAIGATGAPPMHRGHPLFLFSFPLCATVLGRTAVGRSRAPGPRDGDDWLHHLGVGIGGQQDHVSGRADPSDQTRGGGPGGLGGRPLRRSMPAAGKTAAWQAATQTTPTGMPQCGTGGRAGPGQGGLPGPGQDTRGVFRFQSIRHRDQRSPPPPALANRDEAVWTGRWRAAGRPPGHAGPERLCVAPNPCHQG